MTKHYLLSVALTPTQVECVGEFTHGGFGRQHHRAGRAAVWDEGSHGLRGRLGGRLRGGCGRMVEAADAVPPVLEARVAARFGFHRIDRDYYHNPGR